MEGNRRPREDPGQRTPFLIRRSRRRWSGRTWSLLVIGIVLVARRYLDVVEVRGRSMAPALWSGDRLLVIRGGSRVGDIVLARDPRDPGRELIKRVARIDRSGVVLRGDNPAASTDARTFGIVPANAVGWRVAWRYWPPARVGRVPPAPIVEGGESACAFPEALSAGG